MNPYDYAETLAEKTTSEGTFRVLLVPEWDAEKPDHDGQVPVIRLAHRDYSRNAVQEVGDDVHDGILEGLDRFDTDDLWERYVRAFHGTSKITYFHSSSDRSSPTWVAFDSAAWREAHGVTVEQLAEEDIAGDFRAYVDGNVYGYVVQRRETWVPVGSWDAEGALDEDVTTRETWEDVDDGSAWGLYGREHAETAAREALEECSS